MSPDQQALCAAVVANPDDDLPRLVYADWLEEHGDTDRAEFIRVQCRLANVTPADDDYCDLTERAAELRWLAVSDGQPSRPPPPEGWEWTAARRGFCDGVSVKQSRRLTPTTGDIPRQFEAVAADIPLAGCRLHFDDPAGWQLLAHPAAGRLRWLDFTAYPRGGAADALLASPHLHHLRELDLRLGCGPADSARLLASDRFPRLRALRFKLPESPPSHRPPLADAPWREHLTELSVWSHWPFTDLVGRSAFPSLSRLSLPGGLTATTAALLNDTGLYPALTSLRTGGAGAPAFALGALDRPLREIELSYYSHDPDLETFFRSPSLRTVRSLVLSASPQVGGWPANASRPGVFDRLRRLVVHNMPLDESGLKALAAAPFWETVTAVELNGMYNAITPDEWAAFFRTLNAPALRHLKVEGGNLGSAGGVALAGNRSLANLRVLDVRDAGLGKRANKAIVTAPQFQNVLAAQLTDRERQEWGDVLADPGVLPHARAIRLGKVKLSPEVAAKLRRRPEVWFYE